MRALGIGLCRLTALVSLFVPTNAETSAIGDQDPPVLANLLVTHFGGEVTIRWTTNEPATSRVDFGPTENYGLSAEDEALVLNHVISLAGLSEGVTYHFQPSSLDAAGNLGDSPDGLFLNFASDGRLVFGDLVAWHPIQISFQGSTHLELDDAPNPFLDRRLTVVFTGPSGQSYTVPGFFDGDGRGAGDGNVWSVRFAADEGGTWSYVVHFDMDTDIAVETDLTLGTPTEFDGTTGTFPVADLDPAADGFHALGRLEYVGEHYLKHRDGPYFLKGGANSPENLLAFAGFDNTVDQAGGLDTSGLVNGVHLYGPHAADWGPTANGGLGDEADPLFVSEDTGVDSKGLIGALNYLASKHVNSVYFLPMNLGGDGRECYPFVSALPTAFDKTHYDISKLHQWNKVFEHAQRRGILLHIVLNETEVENEEYLDGGSLGGERKLFYRELIARFGHCLAIKWNLSEESDFTDVDIQAFSDYIQEVDPYDHPIAFHTKTLPCDGTYGKYTRMLGDPRLSMTSIQGLPNDMGDHVEKWRADSAAAGLKWVVEADEQTQGLSDINADTLRRQLLYDVYFSGGNVEWYFGYVGLPVGGDLRTEDFRTREEMWDLMWFARNFLEQLPFWEMEPADQLLSGESQNLGGGEVFAKEGEVYAIYLPISILTGSLDLSAAAGNFLQSWYNPRTGLFEGGSIPVEGGGPVALGLPPSGTGGDDWVVCFTLDPTAPEDGD